MFGQRIFRMMYGQNSFLLLNLWPSVPYIGASDELSSTLRCIARFQELRGRCRGTDCLFLHNAYHILRLRQCISFVKELLAGKKPKVTGWQ